VAIEGVLGPVRQLYNGIRWLLSLGSTTADNLEGNNNNIDRPLDEKDFVKNPSDTRKPDDLLKEKSPGTSKGGDKEKKDLLAEGLAAIDLALEEKKIDHEKAIQQAEDLRIYAKEKKQIIDLDSKINAYKKEQAKLQEQINDKLSIDARGLKKTLGDLNNLKVDPKFARGYDAENTGKKPNASPTAKETAENGTVPKFDIKKWYDNFQSFIGGLSSLTKTLGLTGTAFGDVIDFLGGFTSAINSVLQIISSFTSGDGLGGIFGFLFKSALSFIPGGGAVASAAGPAVMGGMPSGGGLAGGSFAGGLNRMVNSIRSGSWMDSIIESLSPGRASGGFAMGMSGSHITVEVSVKDQYLHGNNIVSVYDSTVKTQGRRIKKF